MGMQYIVIKSVDHLIIHSKVFDGCLDFKQF
jgi:hypothetical protein